MKIFYLFILLIISQTNVAIASSAENINGNDIFNKTITVSGKDSEGDKFSLRITSYKNEFGTLETEIKAAGAPKLLKFANPILGYARDIDDNGKIDTWFFIQSKGIVKIKKEGMNPLGDDIVGSLLKDELQSSFYLYTKTAIISIFKHLLLSTSSAVEAENNFYRDWMNLQESDDRVQALIKTSGQNLPFAQMQAHYLNQSAGYQDLANQMDRFLKIDFVALNASDIGLYFTGGIVLNWFGKILGKIGTTISESNTFQWVMLQVKTYGESHFVTLNKNVEIFKYKLGFITKTTSTKAAIVEIASIPWRKTTSYIIRGTKSKNLLIKYAAKSVHASGVFAGGAIKGWKYIALNGSVQLGTEVATRWDEVYSEDPFEMIDNVLNNKEIQQNIAFMTSETILLTASANSLKTTKAKFKIGGMIALTNSTQMNILMNGETDPDRIATDTVWETAIGNTQVIFDNATLNHFEKLAHRNKNPKVKLIGYAIVGLNMVAGYSLYSLTSDYVEENKPISTHLVPIFLETL